MNTIQFARFASKPDFFKFSVVTLLTIIISITSAHAQAGGKRGNREKRDSKDSSTWSAEEYSGLRGEKELQTAMASKCFTWITGSPADNEKLSVGKNAQFFGFVALRYQSGRAANRGTLGRAVYAIANPEQRALLERAVIAEQPDLQEWWRLREEILTTLEEHLYTGGKIDRKKLNDVGEQFALYNSKVAVREAEAFSALEDSFTAKQKMLLTSWRADAERAGDHGKGIRVEAPSISDRSLLKQLEDLYAKSFSWLTGTPEDNEIIPIGQPAQFFGFVSIRHKSGHAASRGKISKSFSALLDSSQVNLIQDAVHQQTPVVREFLENRHLFLNQLAYLRTDPDQFDPRFTEELSRNLGRLETEAARIEAEAYRKIRASMTEQQLANAMKIRSEYIIDRSQVTELNISERGATLSILCAGCHGMPGQHRAGMPGPDLDGMWNRPIASSKGYEFSTALTNLRKSHGDTWTPEMLEDFLAGPKRFAPGTKMEFQGLLNSEDREALVEHLRKSR
ncbi:MAG: c-type cytochrome [Verrucomicrobiota bacterium]